MAILKYKKKVAKAQHGISAASNSAFSTGPDFNPDLSEDELLIRDELQRQQTSINQGPISYGESSVGSVRELPNYNYGANPDHFTSYNPDRAYPDMGTYRTPFDNPNPNTAYQGQPLAPGQTNYNVAFTQPNNMVTPPAPATVVPPVINSNPVVSTPSAPSAPSAKSTPSAKTDKPKSSTKSSTKSTPKKESKTGSYKSAVEAFKAGDGTLEKNPYGEDFVIRDPSTGYPYKISQAEADKIRGGGGKPKAKAKKDTSKYDAKVDNAMKDDAMGSEGSGKSYGSNSKSTPKSTPSKRTISKSTSDDIDRFGGTDSKTSDKVSNKRQARKADRKDRKANLKEIRSNSKRGEDRSEAYKKKAARKSDKADKARSKAYKRKGGILYRG